MTSNSSGRIILDLGLPVMLATTLASILQILGWMPNQLFSDADGVTLFAAMLLFPVNLICVGVSKLVISMWIEHKEKMKKIREEGREKGVKEILDVLRETLSEEDFDRIVAQLPKSSGY